MFLIKKGLSLRIDKSLVTNLTAGAVFIGGYASPYYANYLTNIGLFALSGSFTNWLAIHMLFEKVPGFYGSGVIPNRFEEFKTGIRTLIMDQFFTEENIEKFLSDFGGQEIKVNIDPILEQINFDQLFDTLVDAITQSPFGNMLGMLGGAEALKPLKDPFIEKIKSFLEQLAKEPNFQSAIQKSLSASAEHSGLKEKVESIVASRLDELTPSMVKEIIQEMIRDHLGWLVVWGGVFGGTIGLIAALVDGA